MVADVSSHKDVRSFVAAVRQEFGGIHILVNNAGLAIFQKTADLTPEEWRLMIDTNLSAVYYCCHEVLPVFRSNGGGDVVNISSLAAKNAFAGGAAYNASKAGLNALSEAMMLDCRNEGIRVSTIMPGSVDTGFGRAQSDSARETSRSGASWKIAPEDIAEIVLSVLRTPRRTMISSVEVRPSRPPVKT
jgi:NADP-dependent 3-hydroxy acid dehydrogenase YdfG